MTEKLKNHARLYLRQSYSSERKFVRKSKSHFYDIQYNGKCLAHTDLISFIGNLEMIDILSRMFGLSYSDSECVILEHIGVKK